MIDQRSLIDRWVGTPDAFVPDPAEARLRASGVPVWALVGYWQVVDHDVARVARDYHLPDEAVLAALAYYERHRLDIDRRLAVNAA